MCLRHSNERGVLDPTHQSGSSDAQEASSLSTGVERIGEPIDSCSGHSNRLRSHGARRCRQHRSRHQPPCRDGCAAWADPRSFSTGAQCWRGSVGDVRFPRSAGTGLPRIVTCHPMLPKVVSVSPAIAPWRFPSHRHLLHSQADRAARVPVFPPAEAALPEAIGLVVVLPQVRCSRVAAVNLLVVATAPLIDGGPHTLLSQTAHRRVRNTSRTLDSGIAASES